MTLKNTTRLLVLALFIAVFTVMPGLAQEQETPFSQVYEQVSPSVVSINVVARAEGTGFFNDEGGVTGSGSGFVFDNEGHIITNNHVVDGATRIEVSFIDGTQAEAEIVGLDPDSDLAVIRVDLPDEDLAELQPVEFADSNALFVGQEVVALGSPFGQPWTLTTGVISALDRTIRGLTQFSIGGVIQTDAAINPGNSGGPLLDLQGRVIGVNSQIISGGGRSSAGIGFAVPGNLTQRVAQRLINEGFVQYSYIGIRGGNVTLQIIEALDLPNDFEGVVVSEATSGGPAARAGLQSASNPTEIDGQQIPTQVDIITAINGEPLTGIADLISYLARETQPGDTATLTILRNGEEEIELEVRLTPRP